MSKHVFIYSIVGRIVEWPFSLVGCLLRTAQLPPQPTCIRLSIFNPFSFQLQKLLWRDWLCSGQGQWTLATCNGTTKIKRNSSSSTIIESENGSNFQTPIIITTFSFHWHQSRYNSFRSSFPLYFRSLRTYQICSQRTPSLVPLHVEHMLNSQKSVAHARLCVACLAVSCRLIQLK